MRLTELYIASALGISWTWDPLIVSALLLSGMLYVLGIVGCRQHQAHFPWTTIACFSAGWLFLIIALVSPLHELGDFLFSAHMAQHELLMVVAAPLMIAGRPEHVYMWAFGADGRKMMGSALSNTLLKRIWKILAVPSVAWSVHAAALWIWHIPSLFNATISQTWIHGLQHISFLGTALLFWGALLRGHMGKDNYGLGIVYVFTTAVHTTILGALLTFAASPWYSVYAKTTKLWGFTQLDDQQIGGLIMWVPAGVVYILIGLWLFAAWIRDSDRRSSFASAGVQRAA